MAKRKGNAVVFTQGGPTAVINASWVGIVEGLKKAREVTGIYGAINGIDGILKQTFVNLKGQSPQALRAITRTPATELRTTRHKPAHEECLAMLRVFQAHHIRYAFGIGGNDTSETLDIMNDAAHEEDYELRVFHVAKTVDCDLVENDHTPGYGSAARYVANAFRGVDLDNQCFGGVYVGVCMGRHAGFLTAASALGRTTPASGSHLVYLPEIPFDVERFCREVFAVYQREGRCVVALSEGIEDKDHAPILQVLSQGALEADSHGNVQLSGTGALGDALVERLKAYFAGKGLARLRARGDTLGYIQRSFPDQSEVDRRESLGLGRFAARMALSGDIDGSSAIRRVSDKPYKIRYALVPLKSVAGKTRHMPPEFISPQGNNVTEAFLRWGRPLIGKLKAFGLLDLTRTIPPK
ncbi:MAG: diphosphate--fructose-6-phosphate 1-phosphotransferase [Planctomycetota bacterium]